MENKIPQLINRLANEYTKDVVRNPNGKIFDHIQVMVEETPDLLRLIDSHEALLEAAKLALKYLRANCGGMNPISALETSIAQAEGK